MTFSVLVMLAVAGGDPHASGGTYPLAAALVIDGRANVVDVPTRSLRPVGPSDVEAEQADLSLDKKYVAFNGKPQDGSSLRLYVTRLDSGQTEQVPVTAGGNVRFPRFGEKGTALYFVAAEKSGSGGPENPGKLWRLEMKDRSLKQITTDPHRCVFSPVGLASDFVYISTSCFIGFDLITTSFAKQESTPFGSVRDARSELAASPDGATLLYTNIGLRGRDFMKAAAKKKPELLASIPIRSRDWVQPRFVCPKDVLFLDNQTIWTLDTKSGKITELMSAVSEPAPTQSTKKPEEEKPK